MARYADGYNLFLHATDQKGKTADAIWKYIRRAGVNHSWKILDIGSGDGLIDKLLAQKFEKNKIPYHFDLIEPNDDLSKRYSALNISFTHLKNINTRFIAKHTNQYDLVIASHSIYFFNVSSFLNKVRRLLARRGIACIIIHNRRSDLFRLKKMVHEHPKYWSSQITTILKKAHITYVRDTYKFIVALNICKKDNGKCLALLQFIVGHHMRNEHHDKIISFCKSNGLKLNYLNDFYWVHKQ